MTSFMNRKERYGSILFFITQTISYSLASIVVVYFLFNIGNYNEEMYTPETDYLRWVTPLPAITVCPKVGGKEITAQLKRNVKPINLTAKNVSFLTNLLHPRKQLCPDCPVRWPRGFSQNFSSKLQMLTPPCESHFVDCSWNGSPFSCCQYFKEISTKRGICYSFNSLQTDSIDFDNAPFQLVTTQLKPDANMLVTLNKKFSLHVTDRKSVTFKQPRIIIPKGQRGNLLYKFTETIALPSALELKPWQRNCALEDEIAIAGFNHYSLSACKVSCRAEMQKQICGCRHHLLPGVGNVCNETGLLCLDENSELMKKSKCDCKPSCTGQEINFIRFSLMSEKESNIATAHVMLSIPPHERVVYYAKTTFLETLVGFACLTRLITTASLYDVVIAIWVMLKNYCSLLSGLKVRVQKKIKID